MGTIRQRSASLLIAAATAVAIVALVIPLFLNPAWVAFEQGRAEATAWTGFTEAELRTVTDGILADLVLGPPDFDGAVDGEPVLDERERAHMRDVRGVFVAFFAAAAALAAAALIVAHRRGVGAVDADATEPGRRASWVAVRAGAVGLIAVLATLGLFAFVAFDILFEVFHRLFFAGGTYTFDPTTERLVQLFPFRFWQETAIAFGAVAALVAGGVSVVAHRRLRRPRPVGEGRIVAEPPRAETVR